MADAAAGTYGGRKPGCAEALSDDGSLTGRGRPLIRGVVCGLMTALGGLGHSLPYLIPQSWPRSFEMATTIAIIIVIIELIAIAWIRRRYMETPWHSALIQVVLGGTLVFLTGWIIGSA